MKYLAEFIQRFESRPFFSIRDARIFLKKKRISAAYLHFLLHYLAKRGKIHRLGKGAYTFREDIMVAGFAFQPFYYGLHQALSLHGCWNQATNPVIITPKRVRPGIRSVMGANIVVRRVRPGMFFGFERIQEGNQWLPVSTPEKTLIDFAYFRQKIPEEAKRALLRKINLKQLNACLKKSPSWVKKRVANALKE